MSFFTQKRSIDIAAVSGTLRVVVAPRPSPFGVVVEVALALIFALFVTSVWTSLTFWYRVAFVWGALSGLGVLLYQFSGSELIEFDARKLTLSREFLGWSRTSEYPVSDCSELEWIERGRDEPHGLQCKVGWRTVRFAKHISEEEAIEILTELQKNLPEVAQQLCATPDSGKKHFTTLDLH